MRAGRIALLAATCAVWLSAPSAGAMEVGSNHWVVAWGGGTADPFAAGYQSVSGADPWRSEFLEESAFYTVHRFMDWNRTNNSTELHWTERTQKDSSNQDPVAYEWMIELCNRLHADLWITVPHRTYEDQSYWLDLATLLLDGLDPDLKVYVEYSNETWNYGFEQADYCRQQGLALALDADQYRAGFEFHVYAAVRLFERFEEVWGTDNPRLVKVIAGQSVNTWLTGVHLEALADPLINPNGTTADAYAIAPYFGNGASTIAALESAVSDAVADVAAQAATVAASGLELIAYEGGQHVLVNADTVNRDPTMYDHYTAYLEGIDEHLAVFAHYAHAGAYGSGGAWGAKEAIGLDVAEAHKYRALRDYVAGHTPVSPPSISDFVAPGPSAVVGARTPEEPPAPAPPDETAPPADPDASLAGGCSIFAARAGTGLSTILFLLVVAYALWQAVRRQRGPHT